MRTYSLVVVSNRLPVSVAKENGEIVIRPSSGGLATAMASLESKPDERIWVGWPGIPADDLTENEKTHIVQELARSGCYPVFLTREELVLFYDGYANTTIWPLFHYFQAYAEYSDTFWSAYQAVNKRFSDVVAGLASAEATIWIHDYHLMLLPGLIRARIPAASIGFFLHIPFPTFEIFRLLPQRRAILEGLLDADLIGFHTYDYAHYFLSSVRRVLGTSVKSGSIILSDRTVVVDTFPIGIDYDKFVNTVQSKGMQKAIAGLKTQHNDTKCILSIDRLDYSKGIRHRLLAFERLLQKYPEYLTKISLVMVAVPSRTDVQTYKELRGSIEHMVRRINSTYGTAGWAPISYRFKNLPFKQVVALYGSADVAFVTPLRDGMNLVAKEYVASKQSGSGVLILSEFAGATDELLEAIVVNPNDIDSMVTALRQALTMAKHEQARRLVAMQNRIGHYTVQRWARDFIEQLSLASRLRTTRRYARLSAGMRSELVAACARSTRRLFLLDYDGTLRGFVGSPDPNKAAPTTELRTVLDALAGEKHTETCIISGRPRSALDLWFPDSALTLVAEHGAWIKQNGSWKKGITTDNSFKRIIKPLLDHYAERTPGAVVEEKDISLVWHYRLVPPELAYARNLSLRHELRNALAGTDISVFNGNKIIEIKPAAAQKGTIVRTLLSRSPRDFVFCAGDDYTDEDMFKALPDSSYTVKVGSGSTHARFQIATVTELLKLLGRLAGKS